MLALARLKRSAAGGGRGTGITAVVGWAGAKFRLTWTRWGGCLRALYRQKVEVTNGLVGKGYPCPKNTPRGIYIAAVTHNNWLSKNRMQSTRASQHGWAEGPLHRHVWRAGRSLGQITQNAPRTSFSRRQPQRRPSLILTMRDSWCFLLQNALIFVARGQI